MQQRRSDKISILIVPEDNAEPYSFRIRTDVVKGLYAVGVLLILHFIVGGVFYWRYFDLSGRNQTVLADNARLKEANKRIIVLADQFYILEKDYNKVRELLGVPTKIESDANRLSQAKPSLYENIVPAVNAVAQAPVVPVQSPSRYLIPQKKQANWNSPEKMPTLLPVKGFLTQDFQQDGWFTSKNHTGVDIVARKGSVIRAAGAGVIIFANWTYDFGNLVIVDHGDSILSYYGHNQRILLAEQSHVSKGSPIALLGNSGKSSGPHLHFEIRKNGDPVDPKDYIMAFSESIATTQN